MIARMRNSRESDEPRFCGTSHLWRLALLALAVAPGCADRPSVAGAYRGHRVLLWVFERGADKPAGFASGTLQPGKTLTLAPAAGYNVRFEAGAIEWIELFQGDRRWREEAIPFKTVHATTTTEGSRDLTGPFIHIDWGYKSPRDSVAFVAPIGTLDSAALSKRLQGSFEGTRAELEDLLLLASQEPKFAYYVDMSDVIEVYRILGRSERESAWRKTLHNTTSSYRTLAGGVLMTVGDKEGTKFFCDLCLQATGNREVALIDYLCRAPASDTSFDTILKLFLAPGTYVEAVPPNVGKDRHDRRLDMLEALLRKENRERVAPHVGEIAQWGIAHQAPWVQQAIARWKQPEGDDKDAD